MPTQRKIQLSDGSVFLGGHDYAVSEAVQWFLDGAAESEGFHPGEIEPSPELLAAWELWVDACRELWTEFAPTPGCGFAPEMPEGFPSDAMHSAQGAGVGIDDGEREYSEGMEEELASMAQRIDRGALASAFRKFEDEVQCCIDDTTPGGDA